MNQLQGRQFVILSIFGFVALTFIVRLFSVQVLNDKWKVMAADISERKIAEFPSRGLIFDREGKLIVGNIPTYDLMVVPKKVTPFDTLEFCKLVGISKSSFEEAFKQAKRYSQFKPSIIEKQIPASEYAGIAEQLHKYEGFYGQPRTLRDYPSPCGAHLVGYISEASPEVLETDDYYELGDYIGVSGLERQYENHLRGKRGKRYVVVDVHNDEKGPYADRRYDEEAIAGNAIKSTIDLELQRYGEHLMMGKTGSVVAIEPSSGEVLCMITAPTYDPNLLVGRIRSANYKSLQRDTLKPLYNRALMADQYPPGSTFKLINALIGLQEGVVVPETKYRCNQGYTAGGLTVGCHVHRSIVDLRYSIQTSCNAYYCNVFRSIVEKYESAEIGFNVWRKHVSSFGIGERLGIDLPGEMPGLLPLSSYYDGYHGKGRWKALSVISLAIGQGELGITPLQMANIAATIANRGYFYPPHLVKQDGSSEATDEYYLQRRETTIDKAHFELIVDGMAAVVAEAGGTARIARIDSIVVCGKTGTAQNPHGADHSIFIAFAPRDNPQIAIATYVENMGFGSTWAAPIASLLIEQYLTKEIKRKALEDRVLAPKPILTDG